MTTDTSLDHARALDAADPLRGFRDEFFLPDGPDGPDGNPAIYLCGNSLGLQPKGVRAAIGQELDDWARLGVEGHFDGRTPWFDYHEIFAEPLAEIVGAKPGEVVVMNGLTVNLHLLMVSFYRPTAERYRIVIEAGAFPSDQYAVASQARFHGLNPADAVVELGPREGEEILEEADVEAYLAEHGDSVALVLLGGVNYYTGQAFDRARIARAAHAAGALCGFDLAHAAGNLRLTLHDDDVDFAAWCSYKYLNSSPGGVSGVFVHERFAERADLPRFAGWWGHDPESRFKMGPEFHPQPGAPGWQLSNAPILAMAAHRAAVELFEQAGMDRLREKSVRLTEYLLGLLDEIPSDRFRVITPRDPARRGSQLSIQAAEGGRELFAELQERGVICDFREPDVIRIAPVPLYNSFEDCWRFWRVLAETTAGR